MEKPVAEPGIKSQAARIREPVEIIGQLNKLTQENKILWHAAEKKASSYEHGAYILVCYEAEYKGHTLRLMRKRTTHYIESDSDSYSRAFRRTHTVFHEDDTGLEYYHENELQLELIASDGTVVWSPRYVSILEGLISSVEYQTTSPVYKDFVAEIFAEG